MSADGYRFLRMLPNDLPQGITAALPYLTEGLCPIQPPCVRMVGKVHHFLRITAPRSAKGHLLPWPHVDLPEPHIRMQRQSLGQAERRCRIHSPVEVTGIHGIQMDVPKALSYRLHLLIPQLCKAGIILPLHSPVEVSLSLSVAHQIDSRHRYAPQG